jgi:hypothetical protein
VKLVDFDMKSFQPQELSIWDTGTEIPVIMVYMTTRVFCAQGRSLPLWSALYDQALLIRGDNYHRKAGTSSFEGTFSTLTISPGDPP